jgi:virginiamycin B lyase
MRDVWPLVLLILLGTAMICQPASGALTPGALIIHEYAIPTRNSGALYIVSGNGTDLWFTENSANKIARILPNGKISEFTIPSRNSEPVAIAAGPGQKLWFTEYFANKIGSITSSGKVEELAIPTRGAAPIGITVSPKGQVWYTQWYRVGVGRVRSNGAFLAYDLSHGETSGAPSMVAVDSANTVWFTEAQSAKPLGWITKVGKVGEISGQPTPASSCAPKPCVAPALAVQYGNFVTPPPVTISFSEEIRGMPTLSSLIISKGVIWFAAGDSIGQFRPPTSIKYFKLRMSGADVTDVVLGSDGCLWFTEFGANRIGRITPDGEIREFEIPTPDSGPWGIASTKEGAVWFVERTANKIGRLEAQRAVSPCQ